MTALTVIDAVRNRLGDAQRKERWTDATLLLYVSLCQNDICMFTSFYRKSAHITLNGTDLVYDLPTDCLKVNRFEYLDQLLYVESRNNIDTRDATYPLILKDNLPFNKMEFKLGDVFTTLYTALTSTYGVVVTGDATTPLDQDYGVVVSVDSTVEDPGAPQAPDDVLVYYTAVPPLLDMVPATVEGDEPTIPTDDLILPDIWFQAFLHYVCGMALQDDNDANNIQRGELEGSKYLRLLAHIQKTSAKDFTSNIRTKLTTNFRRT